MSSPPRSSLTAPVPDRSTAGSRPGSAPSVPVPLVVTVLGDPPSAPAIAALTAAATTVGAEITASRVLEADGYRVVRISVHGIAERLRQALTPMADEFGVDVAVLNDLGWSAAPGLLVTDVDSTLIQDEVIELLAEQAGRRAEVAAVTERAMRGELDFAESLHARVACLAGLDVAVLGQVREAVRLSPGARRLCRVLTAHGWTLAAVSGGFQEILDPLAAELGIPNARANRLEVAEGRLTGRVLGAVVDRRAKAETLRELAARAEIAPERTVALGDGANDLDLLAAAGVGIAYNAKPILRAAADATISLPALDAVLGLLGLDDPLSHRPAESPTR